VVVVAVVVSFYFFQTVEWPDRVNAEPRRSSRVPPASRVTPPSSSRSRTRTMSRRRFSRPLAARTDGSQSLQAKLNTIIATAKSIDTRSVGQRHGEASRTAHAINGRRLQPQHRTAINTDADRRSRPG